MNWKKILDVTNWKDVGIEFLWRVLPDPNIAPKVLSWPLDINKLHDVTVRWPIHYSWRLSSLWHGDFHKSFRRFVKVEFADIPQDKDVIIFQIIKKKTAYDIVIDASDYSHLINKDSLKRCFLYFKMHYLNEGYSLPSILPGGFFPHRPIIYKYLPYLRRLRDQKRFLFDTYGRFGLEFAVDIRKKVVGLLSGQNKFGYYGGLEKVRYNKFLREVARAKICVNLPGNADLCCQFTDYFAIGSCVIAMRARTKLLAPLVDKENIIYMKDDASDLVDLCDFYLNNEPERERLCQNSRDFFDKYLHREQLAAYYLYKFFEKLETL